jgi:hypothetical protein
MDECAEADWCSQSNGLQVAVKEVGWRVWRLIGGVRVMGCREL